MRRREIGSAPLTAKADLNSCDSVLRLPGTKEVFRKTERVGLVKCVREKVCASERER